jgi:hypothetical protein
VPKALKGLRCVLDVVVDVLEVLKGVRCMPLCILEAVDVLEVLGSVSYALETVPFYMLFSVLEAVEGEFCLLEVLE